MSTLSPTDSLWGIEVNVILILDEGKATDEARMFHRHQEGKLGAVHWTKIEAREPSLSLSLPISLITDVIVGNNHERLQREDARMLYPSQCLSISARGSFTSCLPPMSQGRNGWRRCERYWKAGSGLRTAWCSRSTAVM